MYALVEMTDDELLTADLIAAPGCYPTAALLAMLPALRAALVEPRLVVDAKSGVSGAGRSPSVGVHFAEVNESVRAYGVGGHRHAAEMLMQLEQVGADGVSLTFVPHLVPMTRGILATVYLRPLPGVRMEAIADVYRELCARRTRSSATRTGLPPPRASWEATWRPSTARPRATPWS